MSASITDTEITELLTEAVEISNYTQALICKLALDGVRWARVACTEVTADAQAQNNLED